MKKEHIMQNAPSGRHRLIHASVASALALISFSVQANTQQFAQTPFYLQNKTDVSGQPKVKHNIMFLIDDSGSMQWNVQGKETSVLADKRITITKEALKSVLKEYGEKQRFQWGLQTLHNNGRTDIPDEKGFTDDWQDVQRRVDGIDPGHATPITRRYYEVVKNFVMPNIKYRCQKSYVIVMSDGDANMSCSNQSYGEDPRESRNTNFNYDRNYYYSGYYRDIEHSADTPAYQYFGPSEAKAYENNHKQGEKFGYFDLPIYDPTQNIPEGEKKFQCQNTRYRKDASGNWVFLPGYKNGKREVEGIGEIIVPYWDRNYMDEKRGMRFFSQTLAEKDIKTAKDGLDTAGKSWDGDPSDPKGVDYSKQLVQTFTVGFGEGISKVGREYLEKGASRPDWYFKAEKKEDLLEAFKTIVENIESDSKNVKFEGVSSTAPATTSTGIPDMAATVHLNTGSWSSQLRFYKLNRDGTVASSSEFSQPSFAGRLTLVNDGRKTYFIDSVADNEAENSDFGISDGSAKDKLEWKNALLKWTGRAGSDEAIKADAGAKDYSQSYRIRPTDPNDSNKDERNLGDILDGSVAAIGDKDKGRQEFLVAAANDGMVHIFRRNDTSSNPYDLKLSYIPASMEREDEKGQATTLGKVLKDIAREGYGSTKGQPHRYMVNGGFVLRQTPDKKQTFMFGAMGQGGRGAYALNIGAVADSVRSSSWNTTVPLFETKKGTDNKLGYTIGSTQIGRVSIKRDTTPVNLESDVRYAGFLASGYRTEDVNSADNETALYVYDMTGKEAGTKGTGSNVSDAGKLLAKIPAPDGKGGLSTPTLVDTDFDGIVDIAYAGDRYGNMFRFDLSGETPSKWSAQMIFQGSGNQPITSAPAVSRRSKDKYVVIFGTGSEIYQNELNNTNGQINAVYGIYDDVSDKAVLANSSELEQQTRESDGEHIYVSDNKVGEGKKGWSLTLDPNERVTVKPTMILRTAVVTIRKYETKTIHTDSSSADVCLPDSTSTQTTAKTIILGVNAENGGRLGLRDARISDKNRRFIIKRENNGQVYYASGMVFDGVVNFTYLNGSKADDSPVTADGDSGGTGTDKELNATPNVPNNKCFATQAERSLLTNSDKMHSLKVEGRKCGLKRISWRELFF
ncbi:PilC family type IV pilus tip adhesin [Neisseria sp. DTU_2021_1001991_1_SI_NGA_ILE_055]|uniref:PilC family type IV pilus tip adhesin n=1 Tax=Neisseria sp. DTU_2021_1001991_1_SI_NGA_ILE_055 TaxID=3077590 RepID=UPI0028E75A80|nr:PilC family type IV pilus tip adhesin [Neisseria sp. DTU_2021_1001991_1_SI_NGA_ILE_055]WNS82892.1 PilC family type IV pilus tip adhesin [Neisseria sp. DTU_2021_1001991_1_SI_NGA_ILE_055]